MCVCVMMLNRSREKKLLSARDINLLLRCKIALSFVNVGLSLKNMIDDKDYRINAEEAQEPEKLENL